MENAKQQRVNSYIEKCDSVLSDKDEPAAKALYKEIHMLYATDIGSGFNSIDVMFMSAANSQVEPNYLEIIGCIKALLTKHHADLA